MQTGANAVPAKPHSSHRTRHRKTRRHRSRRTPAHPQRRPLLPPLVRRTTHLFHAQVICDWIVNVKTPHPASAAPNKSPSNCSPPWKLNSTCLHPQACVRQRPRAYRGWQSMTPCNAATSSWHLLLPLPESATAASPKCSKKPRRAEKRDQPLALSRNSPAILSCFNLPSARLKPGRVFLARFCASKLALICADSFSEKISVLW